MKSYPKTSGYLYVSLITAFLFVFFLQELQAQTPSNYPNPVPEPVDFTLTNILIYIVLPVIIAVVYIWMRRSAKKKEKNR